LKIGGVMNGHEANASGQRIFFGCVDGVGHVDTIKGTIFTPDGTIKKASQIIRLLVGLSMLDVKVGKKSQI